MTMKKARASYFFRLIFLLLLPGFCFGMDFSFYSTVAYESLEFGNSMACFADINNDGYLDIIISGSGADKLAVFKNNSGTGFSLFGSYAGFSEGAISAADYNNDGYVDIVVCGRSGGSASFALYINAGPLGGYAFTKANKLFQEAYKSDVHFIDFDRDGDMDISLMGFGGGGGEAGSIGSYHTKLYENDGKGSFTLFVSSLPPLANGGMAWGDFDNDGYQDLCITGYRGEGFGDAVKYYLTEIYRNNNKSFYKAYDLPGLRDSSCAWGDYNNDGYPDLAISGYFAVESKLITRIYKNSLGSFSTTDYISIEPGLCFSRMAFGDLDNDGYMEFAICGSSATGDLALNARTYIYRNLNGSSFILSTATLHDVEQGGVYLADFDKDKDLDMLVTGVYKENLGSSEKYISRLYKNSEADNPGGNNKNEPPGWAKKGQDSDYDLFAASYTATYSNGVMTLTWPNPKYDDKNMNAGYNIFRRDFLYNIMVGRSSGKGDLVSERYGSPLFGNLISKKKTFDGRNTASFKISGTDYFWRVQAIDPALGNSWASPGSGGDDGWEQEDHIFIDASSPTGKPGMPRDDGLYTYSTTLKFRWTKGVSEDLETGIARFKLIVVEDNVNNPSRELFNREITSQDLGVDIFAVGQDEYFTFSNVPGASYDKTYYAKVRARHGFNLADTAATDIQSGYETSLSTGLSHWTDYSDWSDGIKVLRLLKVDNNLFKPLENDSQPQISYSIISRTRIELFIYTLSGELVRKIDEGEKDADSYTRPWDGKNEDGEIVSSGIYLVNLKAGGSIATERIAVLK